MKCQFCGWKSKSIPEWEKNRIAAHLTITVNVDGTSHIHGPFEDRGWMERFHEILTRKLAESDPAARA